MLTLITGVPGSGKTLYAVSLIHEYLKSGRQVFTDIEGINIIGVQLAPEDWRECPDGAVVVYDECQQRYGPDGAGRSGRSDIQDLEVHRHRGFDIVLITQHPKLLHAHIRRLIGRHHHVFRMYGGQTAKIFTRDGQIDIDKPSQLKDQDSIVWTYPTQYFDQYKSATLHTHKRKLPAWLKRSAIAMLIFVAISGALMYKASDFFPGNYATPAKAAQAAAPERAVASPTQPLASAPVYAVSGCMSSARACRCYGSQGEPLIEMDEASCRAYIRHPLYQPIQLSNGRGT